MTVPPFPAPAQRAAALGRRTAVVERVGLAAVLVLAAALRLGAPGASSFAFDEARLAQLALETARAGHVAAVGLQSSVGVPNFPAAVWIYALPFALSVDPLVATLFTGLLNVLAVAGLWWLVRRAAGPWAGLTSAALYAAAPFAAFYSRAIWSQDLLGPLAVLWAWAAVAASRRRAGLSLAALAFLAGLAPQVHYAGAVLTVATLWLVIRQRLWRRPLPLLAGALAALAMALPFLAALWRADAFGTLRGAILAGGAPREMLGLRRLLEMSIGVGWEWFLLGEAWRWPGPQALALRAASGLEAVLLGAGALALARRLRRRALAPEALDLLLPVWIVSAPLLFLGHLTPPYHQYQLAALPALFALAGYAATLSARRAWGPAVAGLALAVAVVQGAAFAAGLGTVAERLTPGGIGTPLAYPRRAARALQDGGEIVVHAHGDEPAYVGDVAGFEVLLWGYPHRVADGRSVLLVPAQEGAHLLFTFEDLPAWQVATRLGLRATPAAHARREGEPPYVSLTRASAEAPALGRAVEPVTLANGVTLLSWDAQQVDSGLRVLTCWRVDAPDGATEYHQFHHLRTSAEGEPDVVQDVTVSSRSWRRGDTLIVWTDFAEVPADARWVDVGMYSWPAVERVPSVGREGDPLAPIRLPLGSLAAP